MQRTEGKNTYNPIAMQVAASADLTTRASHNNILVVFGGLLLVMPADVDSREQLMRGLAVLADRAVRRRYIASIVTRAGVDLSPTAAWLLVQIEREGDLPLLMSWGEEENVTQRS